MASYDLARNNTKQTFSHLQGPTFAAKNVIHHQKSDTVKSFQLQAHANHLLGAEGVDDRGFANVGVTHKADRDELLVGPQARQLAQQA